ncbi:MAG: cobalt ECF transporter T component CbiQ [Cellulosilyticaceae bacterium]
MKSIDRYAYMSQLRDREPSQKLLLGLLTIVMCLVFSAKLLYVVVIGAMAGITILRGRTPWRVYVQAMLVPFGFLILSVATVCVQWGSRPELFVSAIAVGDSFIGVTSDSMMLGWNLLLKVLACTSCLFFICFSTPMTELLQVIDGLKCPRIITELMGLIYRFIFILVDTAYQIQVAQRARLGYQNVRGGLQSFGRLLSCLLVRTLQMSQSFGYALDSRGYKGQIGVLREKSYHKGRWQELLVIEGVFILSLIIDKYMF